MATKAGTNIATLNRQREPQAQALPSVQRRALRRFLRHRMALTGMIILILIIIYILGGSLIYSEAYANYNDTRRALLAPVIGTETGQLRYPDLVLPAPYRALIIEGTRTAPVDTHLMGTDPVGRDVLARTIYGGQISLLIGIFAMVVSVTMGTIIGTLSGYFGGWLDAVLMRLTEAMLSIPSLLFLLVMAKFFGNRIPSVNLFGRTLSGSVLVIIVIIGLTGWMTLARIVRSQFLSLKEQEFVQAARALGASHQRIILQHVLPNALAPIIVAATLSVAAAILQEAYISFLGLGVQQPTASWGNMLDRAYDNLEGAPWMWIFPGLLVVLTVMSINFVGDGLRDALDPRSDKKI